MDAPAASWQLPGGGGEGGGVGGGGGGEDAGAAESVCCASINGGVPARSRSIANTKAR